MFSIRFLIFGFILFLFSCSKSNIQIYNPYFLDMDIQIDDINYKLKDQSGIFIRLKPGKHHIYSFMEKNL